jgi:hypothetical protein
VCPGFVSAPRFFQGDVEDTATLASLEHKFDVVLLCDTIGLVEDCETAFGHLHQVLTSDARVLVSYYWQYWDPLLRLGEFIGAKMRQVDQNWLSTDGMSNLLDLAGFEIIKRDWRILCPISLFWLW